MTWFPAVDLANDDVVGTFGQPVTHRPIAGPSQDVEVVFDQPHLTTELDGEIEQSGRQPMLDVKLADLDTPPQAGDRWDVAGNTYRADDVEEDGRGMAAIPLTVES